MRYAIMLALLVGAGPIYGAGTNLVPRVQCDLITSNQGQATALANAFRADSNPHSPKAGTSIEAKSFADPDGSTRVFMLYEFTTWAKALAFFESAKLRRSPQIQGRLIIYLQPEEFTSITDWSGSDRDPRAQRMEVAW